MIDRVVHLGFEVRHAEVLGDDHHPDALRVRCLARPVP